MDIKNIKRAITITNMIMGKHEGKEESHNEFHAEYVLNCKSPAEIKSIDFKYFKRFKGAEELDVNIISLKGQKSYEAESKSTKLDVSGSF